MMYITENLDFIRKLSENPNYKNDSTFLQVMRRVSVFYPWENKGNYYEKCKRIFKNTPHAKVAALCLPEDQLNTSCMAFIDAYSVINKTNYKNTYFKIVDVEKIVQIKYGDGEDHSPFDFDHDDLSDHPTMEILSSGSTVILLPTKISVKTTNIILNQIIYDFRFKGSQQMIFVFEGSKALYHTLYDELDVDRVIDLYNATAKSIAQKKEKNLSGYDYEQENKLSCNRFEF